MSTRWMMVQYVGNTLRLPVVNESDMGKHFGSSVLEHEVKRIVVNPFSDNPQTFVLESELKDAEAENVKLREDVDRLIQAVEDLHDVSLEDRLVQMENENESLRELVHILCHCMNLHAKCDDCRLNGSKGEIAHDHLCACDGLYKMLRELGFEVD